MVLEWEVGWLVGESLVMGCFELFNGGGWRLEGGGFVSSGHVGCAG